MVRRLLKVFGTTSDPAAELAESVAATPAQSYP
jgi:hypothetical protein